MHRPTRKLKHLEMKLASKASRGNAGKRAKRWKKWVESYKGLVVEQG